MKVFPCSKLAYHQHLVDEEQIIEFKKQYAIFVMKKMGISIDFEEINGDGDFGPAMSLVAIYWSEDICLRWRVIKWVEDDEDSEVMWVDTNNEFDSLPVEIKRFFEVDEYEASKIVSGLEEI